MERLIDGLSITSVLNMLLQQVCYGVNVQMNYSPFLWSVEVGEKFLLRAHFVPSCALRVLWCLTPETKLNKEVRLCKIRTLSG